MIDLKNPKLSSPADFLSAGKFSCGTAQIASDTLTGAWGFTSWEQMWLPHAVLLGMTLVIMVLLLVVLFM